MSAGLVATNEIATFIEDGWIEEVLFSVKGGKEANVYCCRACPGRGHAFFALKVYKPRKNRSFRDAAMYQEGRVITNARTARAVRNKSRFGRAVEFGAWAHHEFAMLELLHAAGADVPCPLRAASNAILIEFVGQGSRPAPQLRDVRLSPAEAERLLEQALRNIEIMLSCNVVHGDLSAYNMLYAAGQLRVIDLPQAVDARTNRHAKSLLVRDVANVCRYFAAQGADATPGTFAEELWDLYLRAAL
ncbi:MAG TPA: RIO1 family regulatory kinase/ATPase [Burkholderiales bacterium]|nr:RIO1 family regulatory kinase/ATPase [Burkholderiales bacterium]